MKLEIEQLIDQFYEEVKEQFPDLSKESVKEMVYTPFKVVKTALQHDDLKVFKFQFFGTFYLPLKRAYFLLNNLEIAYEKGKVTKNIYNRLKKAYESYITRKEKEEQERRDKKISK